MLKRQLLQYDINPHSFIFNDIPEYFDKLNNYAQVSECLKKFVNSYNEFIDDIKDYLVKRVSELFDSSITGSLSSLMNDWYDNLPSETRNHVFSTDVNTFIHFVRENSSYDDYDVISRLAKSITMLAVEDWNDETVTFFLKEIESYIKMINEFEFEETPGVNNGYIGLSLNYDGKVFEKNITETEISGIAETALNNIESELEDYGDAITAQERVALLLKLLHREIEKL
jgi:hypothetical protein